MFWHYVFTNNSAQIETLLQKEDVTLRQLMEEEELLQECQAQKKKLIDFLCQESILMELVSMVVSEPSSDVEYQQRFKHASLASELLTAEVPAIVDKLAATEELLNTLCKFLANEKPLNPLLASFVSKVLSMLMHRRSEQNWYQYQVTCFRVLDFLKDCTEFIPRVAHHIGTSAVMDLLNKLLCGVDEEEIRSRIHAWLRETPLINLLIGKLGPENEWCEQANVEQLLCDVLDSGTSGSSMGGVNGLGINGGLGQPPPDNCMQATRSLLLPLVLNESVVQQLLVLLLHEHGTPSSTTHITNVLIKMLTSHPCTFCTSAETAHTSLDASGGTAPSSLEDGQTDTAAPPHNGGVGIEKSGDCGGVDRGEGGTGVDVGPPEPLSDEDHEHVDEVEGDVEEASERFCAAQALTAALPQLHEMLIHPPKSTLLTSYGACVERVGTTRLRLVALISALLEARHHNTHATLAALGTLPHMLDLFYQFPQNNFLHSMIQRCITGLLNLPPPYRNIPAPAAHHHCLATHHSPPQPPPQHFSPLHTTNIAHWLSNTRFSTIHQQILPPTATLLSPDLCYNNNTSTTTTSTTNTNTNEEKMETSNTCDIVQRTSTEATDLNSSISNTINENATISNITTATTNTTTTTTTISTTSTTTTNTTSIITTTKLHNDIPSTEENSTLLIVNSSEESSKPAEADVSKLETGCTIEKIGTFSELSHQQDFARLGSYAPCNDTGFSASAADHLTERRTPAAVATITETDEANHPLLVQLIKQGRLIQRILTTYGYELGDDDVIGRGESSGGGKGGGVCDDSGGGGDDGDGEDSAGGDEEESAYPVAPGGGVPGTTALCGYRGHVRLLANSLTDNLACGAPNAPLLTHLIQNLPAGVLSSWHEFLETTLPKDNALNEVVPLPGTDMPNMIEESDDDDLPSTVRQQMLFSNCGIVATLPEGADENQHDASLQITDEDGQTAKDMISAMTYSLSFDDDGFSSSTTSTTTNITDSISSTFCGGGSGQNATEEEENEEEEEGEEQIIVGEGGAVMFEKMCSANFLQQNHELDNMWTEKERHITFASGVHHSKSEDVDDTACNSSDEDEDEEEEEDRRRRVNLDNNMEVDDLQDDWESVFDRRNSDPIQPPNITPTVTTVPVPLASPAPSTSPTTPTVTTPPADFNPWQSAPSSDTAGDASWASFGGATFSAPGVVEDCERERHSFPVSDFGPSFGGSNPFEPFQSNPNAAATVVAVAVATATVSDTSSLPDDRGPTEAVAVDNFNFKAVFDKQSLSMNQGAEAAVAPTGAAAAAAAVGAAPIIVPQEHTTQHRMDTDKMVNRNQEAREDDDGEALETNYLFLSKLGALKSDAVEDQQTSQTTENPKQDDLTVNTNTKTDSPLQQETAVSQQPKEESLKTNAKCSSDALETAVTEMDVTMTVQVTAKIIEDEDDITDVEPSSKRESATEPHESKTVEQMEIDGVSEVDKSLKGDQQNESLVEGRLSSETNISKKVTQELSKEETSTDAQSSTI